MNRFENKKIIKNPKKLYISILILILILFVIFFAFFMVKNFKTGNNKSSQDMVNDVLNIKSYNATIEVEVKSNKNQNKYIIEQSYKNENENSQEVIEPSNIKGVKIIKENGVLKLENSKLNLLSVFENYSYLSENDLDLSSFINDYKNNKNSNYTENDNEIIIKTENINSKNKTIKKLYINKKNGKIEKMEIEDTNKKIAVYILYREVNVNS